MARSRGLLQHFADSTFRLGSDASRIANVWAMVGGGKPIKSAPDQLSFTAVRYHLSFVCYATALLAMRTPLYTGLSRRILGWAMEQLLTPRVFGYWAWYWKEGHGRGVTSCDDPFACRENVMWLGHVLHVACLYEQLTGDARFRAPGGIAVPDAAAPGGAWATDAESLGLHLAACMRINAAGGVPCEPGLVFFQCQNHAMCGLRLLEALPSCPIPPSFFAPERRRFLLFACGGMRAIGGTGGLKVAVATTTQSGPGFEAPYARERAALAARLAAFRAKHPFGGGDRGGAPPTAAAYDGDDAGPPPGPSPSRVLACVPFGHLGSDAWDLTYLGWWADAHDLPRALFEESDMRGAVARVAAETWSRLPPPEAPTAAAAAGLFLISGCFLYPGLF